MSTPFDQTDYARRFGWGRRAVRDAVARGDVIVIVDVLSFSTCVVAAVAHGAAIHPFPYKDADGAARYAGEVGAELKRGASGQRRALSPLNFSSADAGRSYVLPSPNGSTCSRMAAAAPAVFAGTLVNASAVAAAVRVAADELAAAVTVVACGELWTGVADGENVLRPALEDALGAGAILHQLTGEPSPEAGLCALAFEAARDDLDRLVWECASGRELRALGYGDDVRFSSGLDTLDVAPRLRDGAYA